MPESTRQMKYGEMKRSIARCIKENKMEIETGVKMIVKIFNLDKDYVYQDIKELI